MNRHYVLPVVLLVALGCGRAPSPVTVASQNQAAAIPVGLAAIADTQIVQPVTGTGVLGAKEEVPLGFKIGGVLGAISVEAGDPVAAGQVLASLEQPEIAGEVARAEAGLAQAERDLERARALFRDSVIARDRLEAAETGAAVARAGAQIARFNQRYATIRAPAAGTVLRRLAEPGQQVAPGTALLVLATNTRGQVVRVGLADRDAARLRVGDRATVSFDAVPGGPVEGSVARIAAAATPGSGAWEVEVRLRAPVGVGAGRVASGLIGRVVLMPNATQPVRMIPLGALLEAEGDIGVVYVIHPDAESDSLREGIAHRTVVRVAFLDGARAAVSGGLEGASDVIVDGAGFLRDGAQVVVRPARAVAP